jgi:hypothetical protein
MSVSGPELSNAIAVGRRLSGVNRKGALVRATVAHDHAFKTTGSRLFLKDRCTEFIETEELEDPLSVEVEHSQVIGFVQIALDRLKMPA